MSRVFLVAGTLLVSAALAQAGDHASFSPDLRDAHRQDPVAVASPSPVAETPPTSHGKASKRRTRFAKAHHTDSRAVADATADEAAPAPSPNRDGSKTLTIGAIPAPLPPVHDDTKVADAVATLETPSAATSRPPSGNTEAASPTPASPQEHGGGPREGPSETVAALLARHAFENGVPLALAKAVVRIESRGNAHASNHGALGLMQIKYGTARAVGFAGPAVALFAAEINLRYGMKVLAQAWRDAHGDLCGALMRYQSGHLARHASAANRAYCSKARALMASG